MDPKHIEVVSPRDFDETLIKCSTSRLALGSDLSVCTKLFVKRYWHSKITKFEDLNEFVDEVQNDRLLRWMHIHRFIPVDNAHTRLIDEVRVEFSFGKIGRIIEWIVLPRLDRIFSYRGKKIKDILEQETRPNH